MRAFLMLSAALVLSVVVQVDTQTPASAPRTPIQQSATYVGSATCRQCHQATYDRWTKTRMANVITDPHIRPDVIIPDLAKPDPLVTFKRDDIAFVYGSKWKQRYFTKVGDDYFPLGAQWDVANKVWRAYLVPPNADWWVPFYPAQNAGRPTGPLCDGCHSVNYDIRTKKVTEWNVGCEKCHGPGSLHVQDPSAATIINPAKLDYVRANDVCIQCHSQGQPLKNPVEGRYYDWPTGFHVGLDLKDFWRLEEHQLGETNFTHFADGTGHKNRMQGNDFVQSLMYTRGVTCFSCHDVHGTQNNADLIRPVSDLCITCHGPSSPNGPHAPTIEAHTHHRAGTPGNECVSCHMPRIEQTIANVNVRSHTFRFITPGMTERDKVPNSCVGCHTDRTNEWATAELRRWSPQSPWRVD